MAMVLSYLLTLTILFLQCRCLLLLAASHMLFEEPRMRWLTQFWLLAQVRRSSYAAPISSCVPIVAASAPTNLTEPSRCRFHNRTLQTSPWVAAHTGIAEPRSSKTENLKAQRQPFPSLRRFATAGVAADLADVSNTTSPTTSG